mmetsp:Transcript_22552/g.48162  ORF Transcript_22552/g.48162 Transcript_22552/m.48162 type:complete len:205 (-) Transcript_22552:73-687(-)
MALVVAVRVLLWALCCCVAGALYGKPPCEPGEVYASLWGRVFCTSPCETAGGACPAGKPAGTFAEPQCVVEVDRGTAHAQDKTQPTHCGLVCTANSYCPRGSRCTKGTPDSMVTKDMDNTIGMPFAPEDFKGVCTFKARERKATNSGRSPLEMRLSSVLAQGVVDFDRIKEHLPPQAEHALHQKWAPQFDGSAPGLGAKHAWEL